MGLLVTSQFHFIFPRVEVYQYSIFNFQSNEGMTATSVVVANFTQL
jgi:hypothetical protein